MTAAAPAAAPSLSAVLRVMPLPLMSSGSFFFCFLDFAVDSRGIFFIGTPFRDLSANQNSGPGGLAWRSFWRHISLRFWSVNFSCLIYLKTKRLLDSNPDL
jgi:hypothetical protein